MEKEFIDLLEFQTRLKEGVECLFPKRLWLKAEVSAVKSRPGGHCYLELSQSNDKGLVAKASAAIWSSKYKYIAPYFKSVTGSPISEGMVVLLEVQVSYSQLYGFTLVVNDIDPEFSVGVKELERQKTIERLQNEGLMDLQKELSLPDLPYNIAVISAEDAAGYRDFMRHIDENEYSFRINTTLYGALMQGADCPQSIISALDSILESGEEYDAVLIMRGGGSKLDLACYDDYSLSAVIAQYPLPVMTAIGHDQDFHICDMVAHTYVKTPTALADEILSMYEDEDARLSSFVSRMRVAFTHKIALMESKVAILESRIKAADPRNLVKRGYVLALDGEGVVMKGVSGRKKGDAVRMMFPDGELNCEVIKVTRKDE